MSRRLQNRFMCILALIELLLCLLLTIRFGCNLIQSNDTANQLMEQLHARDKAFVSIFDQLIKLDHEFFFASYNQEMKPVSYDKAAECLESLEGLNTIENFGGYDIKQSLREQLGQVVNMGYDLIAVSPNVDLELSEDYQEMIAGCINSFEESQNQYTSEMIESIKSAEKDIIRSAVMILVSVVVSAAIVIPLFVILIRREIAQERGCAKTSDI